MILLENEYIVLEHEAKYDLITGIWKKYTPSAIYREILIFGYEAVVRTQVSRTLSDLRNLPTISAEDSYWTVELVKKYYPLMSRHKIYKSAIILSESNLTRLAVQSMNQEFKITLKDMGERTITQHFDNIAAAREWLLRDDV